MAHFFNSYFKLLFMPNNSNSEKKNSNAEPEKKTLLKEQEKSKSNKTGTVDKSTEAKEEGGSMKNSK